MEPAKLDTILNFVPISETIATSGQPAAEQFAAIAAAGFEVVVNLALSTSPHALPNEAELVAAQGMEYLHLPVLWESPTLENLEQFFRIMDRCADRRVFVHCAMNMRVSVFIMLYRVIRLGVPMEPARQLMGRIWEPDKTWQAFLDTALAYYKELSML